LKRQGRNSDDSRLRWLFSVVRTPTSIFFFRLRIPFDHRKSVGDTACPPLVSTGVVPKLPLAGLVRDASVELRRLGLWMGVRCPLAQHFARTRWSAGSACAPAIELGVAHIPADGGVGGKDARLLIACASCYPQRSSPNRSVGVSGRTLSVRPGVRSLQTHQDPSPHSSFDHLSTNAFTPHCSCRVRAREAI